MKTNRINKILIETPSAKTYKWFVNQHCLGQGSNYQILFHGKHRYDYMSLKHTGEWMKNLSDANTALLAVFPMNSVVRSTHTKTAPVYFLSRSHKQGQVYLYKNGALEQIRKSRAGDWCNTSMFMKEAVEIIARTMGCDRADIAVVSINRDENRAKKINERYRLKTGYKPYLGGISREVVERYYKNRTANADQPLRNALEVFKTEVANLTVDTLATKLREIDELKRSLETRVRGRNEMPRLFWLSHNPFYSPSDWQLRNFVRELRKTH
jgi:hypothetical protein